MASVAKRPWTSPSGEKKEAWIVRYLDKGGRHRQRTFPRKKEADAYKRQVEGELSTGLHIARGDGLTIADVAKHLLVDIDARVADGRLRPCTGKNWHSAFRLHVLPEIGAMPVHEVQAEHLA